MKAEARHQRPERLQPLSRRRDRVITIRAALLGFAGVVLICVFTPINDYALNNTYLIGNCLPLVVVVLAFLFAALINGPLSRYAPSRAFSTGEMTVMLSMMLVGCALPSSGLMRYLPSTLVMPFYYARDEPSYLQLLQTLQLPTWLFPAFHGKSAAEWVNDPIVTGYYQHWTAFGPDGKPLPLPFTAWLRPAVGWGLFLAVTWGAIFCMVSIQHRQWVQNERLMFPLAQIELALVEKPEPGRWFNRSVGGHGFWLAMLAVLFIRIWNGLSTYHTTVPTLPIGYDFQALFADPPFSYLDGFVAKNSIYFIGVGTAYFLSSSVAFSLWVFVILQQIERMIQGSLTGDGSFPGAWDQHFGAVIAFALSILWLGRAHWGLVARQAFRGPRPDEPAGKYLSYPAAFWGLIGCALAMCVWLTVAGASVAGAACAVILLLTLILVITRIIAETGLVFGQLLVPLYRPWQLLNFYGWAKPVSTETFFLTALVNRHYFDFREPLSVYASHSLKVADHVVNDEATSSDRSTGRRLFSLMFLAVIVAYGVSFASTLWMQYHFPYTLDQTNTVPVNAWGNGWPQQGYILDPTLQYHAGHSPAVAYSPLSHIVGGAIFTATLAILKARFAWWPLHPVGYLMVATNPMQDLWFSIFIGWLCKLVILRIGGAKLYQSTRSIFLGLIVGDCLAAGIWLVVSLVLAAMHIPYHAVNFMPM